MNIGSRYNADSWYQSLHTYINSKLWLNSLVVLRRYLIRWVALFRWNLVQTGDSRAGSQVSLKSTTSLRSKIPQRFSLVWHRSLAHFPSILLILIHAWFLIMPNNNCFLLDFFPLWKYDELQFKLIFSLLCNRNARQLYAVWFINMIIFLQITCTYFFLYFAYIIIVIKINCSKFQRFQKLHLFFLK